MALGSSSSSSSCGLFLKSTPTLMKFLSSSSHSSTNLHDDDDEESTLPYKLLRDAWLQTPPASRPPLQELLAGSSMVFNSPQPRKKSAELQARLEKLQDMADRKAYNELVKDVFPVEKETEYFSSYKNQLGFGLHVVVIMFTGYLCGHALFRSQFGGTPVLHAAGGMLGLVLGMLVETLLFIIRASKLNKKPPKLKKKAAGYRYKED